MWLEGSDLNHKTAHGEKLCKAFYPDCFLKKSRLLLLAEIERNVDSSDEGPISICMSTCVVALKQYFTKFRPNPRPPAEVTDQKHMMMQYIHFIG